MDEPVVQNKATSYGTRLQYRTPIADQQPGTRISSTLSTGCTASVMAVPSITGRLETTTAVNYRQ